MYNSILRVAKKTKELSNRRRKTLASALRTARKEYGHDSARRNYGMGLVRQDSREGRHDYAVHRSYSSFPGKHKFKIKKGYA